MTASSPPPDAARSERLVTLIASSSLGDRAAFAELYRETSAFLFGTVLKVQRDRALAEDVLQEVYVNIWRWADRFDARVSRPLTWLGSIARNRAIDSLRRAGSQPSTVALVPADDDDFDPMHAFAAEGGDALELLGAAKEKLALERCIDELTNEQKQCLSLAFYQGLSHSEVADHLRQPLGTVKSWVRRALQSLKSCLGRAMRPA